MSECEKEVDKESANYVMYVEGDLADARQYTSTWGLIVA